MSLMGHQRKFRVALVVSALRVASFPTFSTAASISSVVLLRRLRQRCAKASRGNGNPISLRL